MALRLGRAMLCAHLNRWMLPCMPREDLAATALAGRRTSDAAA